MTTMRPEVIFAIRDARGLDANEKAILLIVESRGIAYGTRDTMAEDCGMTTKRFYGWRSKLVEKGLLQVTERPGTTTTYRVEANELKGWSRNDPTPETTLAPPRHRSHLDAGRVDEMTPGVESKRLRKVEPPSTTTQVEPSPSLDVWEEARRRSHALVDHG